MPRGRQRARLRGAASAAAGRALRARASKGFTRTRLGAALVRAAARRASRPSASRAHVVAPAAARLAHALWQRSRARPAALGRAAAPHASRPPAIAPIRGGACLAPAATRLAHALRQRSRAAAPRSYRLRRLAPRGRRPARLRGSAGRGGAARLLRRRFARCRAALARAAAPRLSRPSATARVRGAGAGCGEARVRAWRCSLAAEPLSHRLRRVAPRGSLVVVGQRAYVAAPAAARLASAALALPHTARSSESRHAGRARWRRAGSALARPRIRHAESG
jgi:hypothetical protein